MIATSLRRIVILQGAASVVLGRISLRSVFDCGAIGGSGTIDIAHNGSVEALVGNQTSLYGAGGVSFDTPFQTVTRMW